MKLNLFCLLLIVSRGVCAADLDVQVVAKQHAKVPLFFGVITPEGNELQEIAQLVKRDLEFSGQFDVAVVAMPEKIGKKEIKELLAKGYPLALFVNESAHNAIEWRVYDTIQGDMVKGKKYTKRGIASTGWAHNIADLVWPVLTGQDGFFSTKIAYCKDVKLAHKKIVKYVCLADYDGSNEQVLVSVPTVNVAPRWNNDVSNPLLFYSEYTNENVRLVGVDMKRRRRITSDFEGINMLPAFSHDGKKVVYCASRGDGNCQLYYGDRNGIKKLTNNSGHNISPTLSTDDKTIYFCSDYQTGSPQIYVYRLDTGAIERITQGGYCASPAYSSKRGQLAYAKMIDGQMQVMVYDERTKAHTQLTTGAGSKEECSWSPCGNYLIYAVRGRSSSQIAMLNLTTKQQRFLTDKSIYCGYPAWSPMYEVFPTIQA